MYCFYLLSVLLHFITNIKGYPDSRILGGDPVSIYDHPYQVSIHQKNPSNVFAYICGGTLVRPNAVITAAQCTTGTIADKLKIHAGSSYHSGAGGEIAYVARIIQHPDYVGFPNMANDISILILKTSLPTTTPAIKLVTMPYQGQEEPVGTKTNVTGWGSSDEGGPLSDFLRKVTIPIVDQPRCASAYSGFVNIVPKMLCAGVLGVGGQDFCQRDTGGPLVVNKVLHGIISFGYSCGNPNFPGVYTRVSSFSDWINKNVV